MGLSDKHDDERYLIAFESKRKNLPFSVYLTLSNNLIIHLYYDNPYNEIALERCTHKVILM